VFVGGGGKFGYNESCTNEYSEVSADNGILLDNVKDDSDVGDD
jgi:hypothetical protein